MSPHALSSERDYSEVHRTVVKQSPRKISKSNSDVLGKHLLGTGASSSGLFKNISTDFFGNFNESPFGNEVMFDLFPGLDDSDKKDDAAKRKELGNAASQTEKKIEPLFSSASPAETQTVGSAGTASAGQQLQQSNQTTQAGGNATNNRPREPEHLMLQPIQNKQLAIHPSQLTMIPQRPIYLDTKVMQNVKPVLDEMNFETRSNFFPVSPADHFSLRLAQQVIDITFLPYRVKAIKDAEDDFVESLEEQGETAILMGNFSGIIKANDGREITSVAGLSGAMLTSAIPPLTAIITTALNSPIPRSAGAPTNVNLAQSDAVDHKTLKKLRNRVSASRCRLRRRVWATGIEKTERSLIKLHVELENYVLKLDAEKDALLKVLGTTRN